MEEKVESDEKKLVFRHPPLFDRPHPYLAIVHGQHRHMLTFYNLSQRRYYTITIPELRIKNIHDGGGNGWIYVENIHYCFFLNFVTMEKVKLPPLSQGTSVVFTGCIISSPPSDPDCRLMFYSEDHVETCKPGDESFVKLDLIGINENVYSFTMFQGRIYGVLKYRPTSTLVVAEPNEPNRFKEVQLEEGSEHNFQDCQSYLVESCGELLRVHSYCINNTPDNLHFKVFVADFSKMKWVRLNSIGNRAIFVNAFQCWSCSTTGLEGVRGNTIYFIYHYDRNMHTFSLDDESISIYLPCPNVGSRGCLLSWIFMPSTK